MRALVAYVVLLAMVVGLPIVLYTLVGPPWPDRLPNWEQVADILASPDDGTIFIAALQLLVWGAWAQLILVVICEFVAKARGRRISPRLPGLRGVHRLAAYLVASATLAVLSPGSSNAAAPPPIVSMAPLHPLGQPVADEPPADERVYQVQEGDSLWTIADEQLGSPRRWPKIWKLNARSDQPGGHTFTDPALIQPGWHLHLPAKRSKPPNRAPAADTPSASHVAPTSSSTPDPQPSPADPQAAPQQGSTSSVQLSSSSLVAVAYVAGISTAFIASRLNRRRRRILPGAEEVVEITPEPEPPPEIRELHRIHRRAFAQEEPPMPTDGELVRRADSIHVPKQAHIGQAQDGRPVCVDLEGPGIGFTGPGTLDVVRYLTVDLLRQSSNYRTQIIISMDLAEKLLGLSAPDLKQTAMELTGLQLADSHEDALRHFEETFFQRRRMVLERDSSDIDELRELDPGEALPVVLLITELDDEVYEHVTAPLTSGQNTGVGAVFLGAWPGGDTLLVSDAHRVEAAEGRNSDAFAGATLFNVTAVEAAAHVQQLASSEALDTQQPAPTSDDGGPRWLGSVLVRLTILGQPTVNIRDRAQAVSLSWLQMNTLTYLALHPNGVTRDQLAAALWPDDSGKDIHNTLRHLRSALVTATGYKNPDPKKAPFISASTTKDSAIYRLDPQLISVDLWEYQAALEEVRTALTPEDRAVALTKAAALCTGELAQGLTAEWIEDQRYPLTRSQADVLAQLAELLVEEDPERALIALEQARVIDPDTEETYFRIMRLQLQLGRRDDASRTAELLRQHQQSLGVSGDYQTEKHLGEIFQP
ncbi:LysM peptidoglycan-binding domain-containing protein [Nonomuraea sp. FMUSA5-5]|uniref:LysM peptidoglycan-binding domain-containing protein n=1 Tax=Nonomuraea composti TaxID=2720023 RepID=A0ABX1BJV3_9ACTN|nr:LysM peptidoglycan-binding domain-containing protein [Nonomuraea sp. FMUSA5-5]NJP98005.1 LysM peptidoglycan-binding domain-containing protein [Nonomuraea sp. FMUSA5-5]